MIYADSLPNHISRLLICGIGSIGQKHLKIFRSLYPNMQIGVLRSGHGKIKITSNDDINAFYDIEQALHWQPNAAIICTPATDHLSKALQIGRHNIPMLIEKPIGTDLIEADKWEELKIKSFALPILVGYVLRHDPCLKVIEKHIKSEVLGKIIEADFYCGSWLPNWRPNQDYQSCVSARRELGGGVLLELSHELDLVQLLFGSIRLHQSIIRNSGLLDIDVEDQAILFGESSLGVPITIRLNFCTNPPKRSIKIRGSDGDISWDIISGKVQLSLKNQHKSERYESNCKPEERYEIQAKHFVSCVTSQTTPTCTVSDGIKVLELVNKARQMSSTGLI